MFNKPTSGACQSRAPTGLHSNGRLQALPTNIRQGLGVTNAIQYMATITALKSFMGTACYDLKRPLLLLSELCQGKQKKGRVVIQHSKETRNSKQN